MSYEAVSCGVLQQSCQAVPSLEETLKIPLPPPTLSSCQPWIPGLFQGLFFWAWVGAEHVFFAM